ncbi:DGQHR domain-containing protein [Bacillus mycoides]|uniref:DGQHR domain-containing protein n=1 Tax=Bacillus mycoides TaxID=1405 RepID=A0A4U3AD19_BACMY|nr:DGQHR domain-containing protein [Bacillus mycoides]QWG31782.1 DGQHR domain-containing protein [Bacillus mycoides]TKI85835.1 DGQHR domain-containing protein [Bacillus mycoides]
MSKIVLKAIKTNQPIGDFYIAKINARELYEISTVDRLMIEMQSKENELFYKGIQREINESKVQSLEDYIESPDATFPNSIILNVDEQYVISKTSDSLVLRVTNNTFSVIDGQHRLESFREYTETDFELVVSIFIGLSIDEQARIFTIINSEQTKVNPSVQIFQELHDKVYTPRKMAATITTMFAKDIESPWVNKVKLLGIKDELSSEGIISLSAFVKPIIGYIYDDRKYHFVRTKILTGGYESIANLEVARGSISVFWKLYIQKNEAVMYKILFNYYKSISVILKKDWKSKESLLTKTTGYNALMLLFKDVFEQAELQQDFSIENFNYLLSGLKKMEGTINSKNYGTSGEKASNDLYKVFKSYLNL